MSEQTNHEEWLLDVSHSILAWVPINENGDVVVGYGLISTECPGNAVGVFHIDGQDAAEQWCEGHPEWQQWIETGTVPEIAN